MLPREVSSAAMPDVANEPQVTFAPGLLDDLRVVIAGAGGAAAQALLQLQALGAAVAELPAEILADEAGAAAWARDRAPLHALLFDAGAGFGAGGADALRATLDQAWRAIHAVATGALIEAGAPGRLLIVAPRREAGHHAPAARAALENLARTLSVEWARYGITAVAMWPGRHTTDAELAQLTCFLLSPAGGYFSGCRWDLGNASVAAR
jgi:NAD(P)-dependent dehydrogenase (short-subunit alcohol dehydrogenase family)